MTVAAMHIAEKKGCTPLNNIFVERLWRSFKYECVYLHT